MARPNCPAQKTCVDCKKPYKPTSNVQKRCPECKAEYNKSYARAYAATNGGRDGTAPRKQIAPAAPKKINGQVFHGATMIDQLTALADLGCNGFTFGNVKITIEKI